MESFRPEYVRTILIISSTGLGDTLLSTPAISSIRQRYPRARIIAFMNYKNMELFADNPDLDMIIPYRGGYRRFLRTVRQFRNLRPDVAVILHGNEPQATPYCYLSGARYIVKVPKSPEYGYILSNADNGISDISKTHSIDVRLKAASLIGGAAENKRMTLNVDKEDEAFVEEYLKTQGISSSNILIGFQTGAAKGYKVWPDQNFIGLGKKLLAADPRVRIVLTGAPNEIKHCEYIADNIGKGALSTAGKIPLKHTRALIKRLSLLVTNDTGTMHMAIALGTRTVSLFCPTDYRCYGPLYDLHLHRVIAKEKPCPECRYAKCKEPFCMGAITTDEVFRVIEDDLLRD
ncbi:MAG: glycosyltransferase family 9 protein [Nitrospirae bacterium]|nr:glycosyltransferase family 9 protein [Nitrospirota bacterium]